MAIKLLENIGIENTGVGASALNNLITGNKSGIVGNYLNECAFTATGNTIIIDTGLLIICGRQVEIDAIESITLSSLPSEDVRYQIVIELIKEESGEVTASIFARKPSTLIQENLLKDGFVYQFELGRVTHKTTGQVTEALRTADILYGQSGAGADIEIGEVNTQMISTELPAEVNINKTVDGGKTKLNFDFSLPKPYEDSVTGLVYSTQIAGNPVNIQNTNDGFVDKVKITNDTASAISSPLTGKSVGKNLFDKHNAPIINGYFQSAETEIVSSTVNRITYIKCQRNTTYSVSKLAGSRFAVGYTNTLPNIGVTVYSIVQQNSAATLTITTGNDAEYLCVYFVNTAAPGGHTEQEYIDSIQIELGSTATDYEPYTETAFSIPLKDTSGTVLDLNPADEIKLIDGKYHLNDIELHDESQDALRAIATKQGQTNLIGDQPFTFDVTELAMGIGEKKYALLTDGDGNAVMPATEADNVILSDGRTVEYAISNIDNKPISTALKSVSVDVSLSPQFFDFVDKDWSGFTSLIGQYIWTDGNNIYYSASSTQKVLDVATSTWNDKTWSGFTSLIGQYIWTDGNNIYYSNGSTQKVLDVATSTWNDKTWSGLTSFSGQDIWTDGNNIYCSLGTTQKVFNITTSTWSDKTWSGMTDFYGQYIWTDGTNIYYSWGTTQKVLNIATSTWSDKTWNGLTDFYGPDIWTDGTNIYYSFSTTQKVLDVATSTWSDKTWSGLTDFSGRHIWADGTNIYYSNDTTQKVLITNKKIHR